MSATGVRSRRVLFVIGAILAFAVNIELQYVSLDLIGYILMGAGLVVFLIGPVLRLFRLLILSSLALCTSLTVYSPEWIRVPASRSVASGGHTAPLV